MNGPQRRQTLPGRPLRRSTTGYQRTRPRTIVRARTKTSYGQQTYQTFPSNIISASWIFPIYLGVVVVSYNNTSHAIISKAFITRQVIIFTGSWFSDASEFNLVARWEETASWDLKSIHSDLLSLTSPQDASWALLQCTICILLHPGVR
jgi:hypothetical protein